MKRIIVVVLIIVAVLVGGFFAVRAYLDQQREVVMGSYQTVTAGRGSLISTVGATGTVRANQTAVLVWQTTGTVGQVLVNEGDLVEKDQILAVLDKTSLSQNIILAEADLIKAQNDLEDLNQSTVIQANAQQALNEASQAVIEAQRVHARFSEQQYDDALEDAREAIVDAQDALDTAEEDFEPYQDWAEDNQTRQDFEEKLEDAQRKYDEAVRKLNELELQADTARANLELAQAQFADAQREYDRVKDGPDPDDITTLETRIAATQAALDMADIEAPFAGTVTRVETDPGDQAGPSVTAFRIDDLSRLLVEVEISEVDINRIQLGQTATFTFDAVPNIEYHGTITKVSQVGDIVQGIVQFNVTVELTDADGNVRPGMTAAVNIVVEQFDNVLLVPNRAVRVVDGQRVIYLLRGNQLERVPVVLGASSGTESTVTEGNVQVGDIVVINPPREFSEGMMFGR